MPWERTKKWQKDKKKKRKPGSTQRNKRCYKIDERIKLSPVFKGLKSTGEISFLHKNCNIRKQLMVLKISSTDV